ncbi:hypothetical protein ID866_4187 [Astraeus odoratus]|nr:hypothetical protein ID866_4187 [Astraeus odoratus]
MDMNSASTVSLLPHDSKHAPRKDYSAALADLQSSYGFCGGIPAPAPRRHSAQSTPSLAPRKWLKWPVSRGSSTPPSLHATLSSDRSRSQADLANPPTPPKNYEGALWDLTESYGRPGAMGPTACKK